MGVKGIIESCWQAFGSSIHLQLIPAFLLKHCLHLKCLLCVFVCRRVYVFVVLKNSLESRRVTACWSETDYRNLPALTLCHLCALILRVPPYWFQVFCRIINGHGNLFSLMASLATHLSNSCQSVHWVGQLQLKVMKFDVHCPQSFAFSHSLHISLPCITWVLTEAENSNVAFFSTACLPTIPPPLSLA